MLLELDFRQPYLAKEFIGKKRPKRKLKTFRRKRHHLFDKAHKMTVKCNLFIGRVVVQWAIKFPKMCSEFSRDFKTVFKLFTAQVGAVSK